VSTSSTHDALIVVDMLNRYEHEDSDQLAESVRERVPAMRRMIDGLPQEHRTVIDLAYYHGRSVTEIGDILSIPVATVKTRMFYARKKLGEALQAAGYDRGWP